MTSKIDVVGSITQGIQIGLRNFVPLVVNTILFILTIWIPYLNVGTIIGMTTLPAKMARDQSISMTEIFDPAYRKFMGEFFLGFGLMQMGVLAGLIFFGVPGIVIAIAWSFSLLLIVDRGLDPMEALRKSNGYTYGNKLTMFLTMLAFMIAYGVVFFIVSWVGGKIHAVVGALLSFALMLLVFPIAYGINAHFYKTLAKD